MEKTMAKRNITQILLLIFPMYLSGIVVATAQNVQADVCDQYTRAVEPKGNLASGLPDTLLVEGNALKCLLRIIATIKPSDSSGSFSNSDLNRFVSTSGAV